MAEHIKNKTPSNLPKHEQGQARTDADKSNAMYFKYRQAGGKLTPNDWKKKGKPAK